MVEFVVLVSLILLPTIYLIIALGRVQAAAFATEAAARHGSIVVAAAQDEASSAAALDLVVHRALADQGFAAGTPARTVVSCAPRLCTAPESRVTVQVATDVALPGVPGFLAGAVPASVTVSASGTSVTQRFR